MSATKPLQQMTSQVKAAPAKNRAREQDFTLPAAEEEAVLQLNLKDLDLPKVHDLNVEGLKPSWLERLFGKR